MLYINSFMSPLLGHLLPFGDIKLQMTHLSFSVYSRIVFPDPEVILLCSRQYNNGNQC
jgi:hypothetical protein